MEEGLLPKKRVAPLLEEGKELTSIFMAARCTTRSNSE
jgi:hypothetical protein